ncbi:hypothetical protein K449DRAFT_83127 [Hypoxylon sp. EC38]|nr:hypothetical protein K449DRAFT_83127 [Hypoxylon sp. EC38]
MYVCRYINPTCILSSPLAMYLCSICRYITYIPSTLHMYVVATSFSINCSITTISHQYHF